MKFATMILAGALAVSPALAQQTAPAQAPNESRAHTMRVVIDAGHGGMDTGLVSSKLAEKDATLQFALELRTELERRGVQVVMTRASDVLLPLNERVRISTEFKADCFLSLHSLSKLRSDGLKPSPSLVLYYFAPASKPLVSALSPAIAKELHSPATSPAVAVSRQRFYVLRQQAPAAMVSVDFQALPNPRAQAPLVRALADGTVNYLKSQTK